MLGFLFFKQQQQQKKREKKEREKKKKERRSTRIQSENNLHRIYRCLRTQNKLQ